MDFKKPLYKNYFKTQVARLGNPEIRQKINASHLYYRKEIIPLLPKDKSCKILEVGCGYGALLLLLKELGYCNVTGIDISQDQIRVGKELGVENIKNVDVFEYLQNKKGAFDTIVGVDVIEHLPKARLMEFLGLSYASLTSNGSTIFRTPNGDAPFGSTYYWGDFTHEIVLNAFSAEQIMLTAGFSELEVFPSLIKTSGFLKNIIRSITWSVIALCSKIILFASGKSAKQVLLSPNLIIHAKKSNLA